MTIDDRIKTLQRAVLAAAFCGACATAAPSTQAPDVPSAENDQQATCRAAKDPMNPLIVEWPATARTALQTAAQRGLVVVSYHGCTMKVLEACDGGGSYRAAQLSQANSDSISIDSEEKLFAELPMGIASLRGRIQRGERLTLEYTTVGKRVSDGEPLALQGTCQGATHYVQAMTVGAYLLSTNASQGGSVEASGLGATAGGETHDAQGQVRVGGDLKACRENPEGPACSSIIQLSMAALPEHVEGRDRAGFGSGLGGLAPLPTIGKLREVELDFSKLDTGLLTLVEAAVKREREQVDAEQKRDRWHEVTLYPRTNAYKDQALAREEAWALVAEGEARYALKARQVCDKNATDTAKLQQLLAIDEAVLSGPKKQALQAEFDRAYAPFKQVLADCDTWRERAGQGWVGVAATRADARDQRAAQEKQEKQDADVAAKEKVRRDEREASSASVQRYKTIGMVSSGVMVVGGLVLLGLGAKQASEATSDCSGNECPASAEGDVDGAVLLGNIGLITAGVGAVGFAVSWYWPVPATEPEARRQAWIKAPPPGRGVSFSGSF